MSRDRLRRLAAPTAAALLTAVIGGTLAAFLHAGGAPVEIAAVWTTGGAPRIEVLTVPQRDLNRTLDDLHQKGAQAARNGVVRALGTVASVQADDPRVSEQWAYQRLGGSQLASAGATGSGVVVAVLDTGVDGAHPEFAGRILPGYDIILGKDAPTAKDPGGHGTHVAGIIAAAASNGDGIAGLAPGVQILPVRVLDETGYGDDAGVGRGLVWAVDHGAQVVNMSLGTYDDNPVMRAAVEYAQSKGVAVIAAAGNDGAGGPTSYPGAYPSTLAVAATTARDGRAYFSTTGNYVDVAAPGDMILSTFPDNRYVTLSGTSMATPYTTAAVALTMVARGLSPLDAVARVKDTAVDLGAAGRDSEFGVGLISPTQSTGTGGAVPPLENPPGMPGFGDLPMPTLPPMTLPDIPDLPSVNPGWPNTPDVSASPLPAPQMPKLPTLPNQPGAPTLPKLPTVGNPSQAPLPTPSAQPPAASPGKPGNPTVLPNPKAGVAVVAAATKSSASAWTMRVQVAGAAKANAPLKVVDSSGRTVARGKTSSTGLWTGTIKARPGTKVAAVVNGKTSNILTLR